MENSSLDIEPPSKFEGKKEVSKKKNGTLPQLIISLKNKNRNINAMKNLEEQIKSDWQKYIFDIGYLKTNENIVQENSTATVKAIEFTNGFNINPNQIIPDFRYGQKRSDTEFTEKRFSKFYDMGLSYSFTPQIKEENKKEDMPSQPKKEEESEEIPYLMYNFNGETEEENPI